ncbi:MAG: rhodanese-like domain-containing protein [Nitrososphaeraceae archaeon]
MKQGLKENDALIVDSRTEIEHIRARIPGSKLHGWMNGIGEGGLMFKNAKQLLNEFKVSDISENKDIICYCHCGTRASHKFLQFKQAGFKHVRCYDGSMIDWAQKKNPMK